MSFDVSKLYSVVPWYVALQTILKCFPIVPELDKICHVQFYHNVRLARDSDKFCWSLKLTNKPCLVLPWQVILMSWKSSWRCAGKKQQTGNVRLKKGCEILELDVFYLSNNKCTTARTIYSYRAFVIYIPPIFVFKNTQSSTILSHRQTNLTNHVAPFEVDNIQYPPHLRWILSPKHIHLIWGG